MRPRLLAYLCALTACLHVATFLGAGPLDDDYIVYRYAENLIEGRGLVFNPGERVEGVTTPLWTLVMAVALAVGAKPWVASAALSTLAAAAATLATAAYWSARAPESRWPVPALILAASPALAMHAAGGLGTVPMAALLMGWLVAWVKAEKDGRAPTLAAALVGLACLTRQEAVLFALPFVATARGARARVAALALGPTAAWCAFRWTYYGALLPATYHVKALPLAVDLRYGLTYLLDATAEAGVGLWVAVVLVHLSRRARSTPRPELVAGASLVAHTAYVVYVGGDYMGFARFFVPTLPVAVALACWALREPLSRRSAVAGAAWGVGLFLLLGTLDTRRESRTLYAQNEARWNAVGAELRDRTEPGTRIAVSAVGAIGYRSQRHIVDVLGITNGALADVEPDLSIQMKGHHRHDADWVMAQEPDLVLIGAGVMNSETQTLALFAWEKPLLEHPELARSYRPMSFSVRESYPLFFYLRDGAPIPIGARDAARR